MSVILTKIPLKERGVVIFHLEKVYGVYIPRTRELEVKYLSETESDRV